MLSVHTPKPATTTTTITTATTSTTITNPFLHLPISKCKTHLNFHSKPPLIYKPISAKLSSSQNPETNTQQQVYQPFRPPPSPLPPKFRSLDAAGRFDVLSNRLGLWFEYAPLLPALVQDGFSPSSIEEATGISGVEQNRLIVGAKVRQSLETEAKCDPKILSFFETSGAELLYEIRLLSVAQRAEAARYIVEKKFDASGVRDLAKSIKDFPRRRGDKGWEKFNYNLPGDCLAFMCYRQGREHKNPSEQRTNALQQALQYAETESAKKAVLDEIESRSTDSEGDAEDQAVAGVKVPLVRMKLGEVGEATSVAVLPVCRAEERGNDVLEAPSEYKKEGEFGVVIAEKGWKRWVVLPGWDPLVGLGKGGVAIAFNDARALPWKVNRWYKEEAILVVADRQRKEVVADQGFYLVTVEDGGRSNGLKVERGSDLIGKGVKESLGIVVLVVRPPRDENDDQIAEEDWD